MEVLAEPQPTMAWVCAQCGHGSPEPRDRQAHLDAHRQLRQFLREWDAAAAVERRSRRPLFIGSAALLAVILLAVVALLRLTGGGGAPTTTGSLSGPDGGTPLPPAALQPAWPPATVAVPSRPDPSSDGGATGRTAPAPPITSGAALPSASAAAPSGRATAGAGIAPPLADPPAVVTVLPPVLTVPPPPGRTPRAGLAVQGCLLVICVDLGP